MAQFKIVANVTDKHGNPLIGLDVELVDTSAFTAANHDPIEHVVAVETTDISGTATFTGLDPAMYYARPRITRDDIRIQMLMPSGQGAGGKMCYAALVQQNGLGTHTTIQAAITALGTSGGVIFVCAGTYEENLTVAGGTSDLWIIGAARGEVTIRGQGTDPTVTVAAVGTGPVTRLRFEHLTLDHVGAYSLMYFNSVGGGQPTSVDLIDLRFVSGATGIDMSDANGGLRWTIRDCVMESGVVYAGQLEVSGLHVTNCKFYCSGKGLYLAGDAAATGIRASACRFAGGSEYSLRVGVANDVVIDGCRVVSSGTGTRGIWVGNVSELTIENCVIDIANGYGISLGGTGTAIVINGCSLSCASGQSVARSGIYVHGNNSDIIISDTRTKGFESYGIELASGLVQAHFIIDGVMVKNGEDTHSIYIDGWDYGTITGCVLRGTAGAATTYGVYGTAGTTNVVVIGNTNRDHDNFTNLVNGVDGNVIGSNTGDGGGMGPSPHDAVTLDANADTLLSLNVQELGLDTQLANLVFAGPVDGDAAVPTFRALVDADIPAAIMRDQEHTDIGDAAPHHAAVTLGGGSDPILSLVGQELTLGDVATQAELDAHAGAAGAHHDPVTLGGGSDPILSLVGQELTLGDVATQAELGAHAGDDDAHHARYTDAEAVAAWEDDAELIERTGGPLALKYDAGEAWLFKQADGTKFVCFDSTNKWVQILNSGYLRLFSGDYAGLTGQWSAATGLLQTDTISEVTADAGVTIEGIKSLDSFLEFTEIAKPGNPAANKLRLYVKDKAGVSALYFLQDDGTEVEVGAGGGGGQDLATDTLWAAAGDLVKGTGDDAADILSIGANGQVLTVVAGVPAWAAPSGGTVIIDGDADTKVDVEESADEDKVRMDVAGTERFVLQNTTPHFTLTGRVRVSGETGLMGTTPGGDIWLAISPSSPSGAALIGIDISPSGPSFEVFYGLRINPASPIITSNTGAFYGVYGSPSAFAPDGATAVKIIGMYYAAYANCLGTGTVSENIGVKARPGSVISTGGTLTITEMAGLRTEVPYIYELYGTLIVAGSYGIKLDNPGFSQAVSAFGVYCPDVTGATNNYLLELGPTPYLRLLGSGSWTPTANQTPLYLACDAGPTLRQVTIGAANSGGTGYRVLRVPN